MNIKKSCLGLIGASVTVLLTAGLIILFIAFTNIFAYLICGTILFMLLAGVAMVGYDIATGEL